MIEIKIADHAAQYIIVTTNAPKSYDGFGTITVNQSGDDRVVAIQEPHFGWQTTRYGSGLYGYERHDGDNIDRHYAEQLWKKLLD